MGNNPITPLSTILGEAKRGAVPIIEATFTPDRLSANLPSVARAQTFEIVDFLRRPLGWARFRHGRQSDQGNLILNY
jgi:hypothetical protein